MSKAKREPRQPKHYTEEFSLPDAVSEAFGEITALAEEMREAFDNTPDSLQQSGVGEARGQAADDLENISEVEVPGEADKGLHLLRVQVPRTRYGSRNPSRAARRDDACATLQACMDMLDTHIEKMPVGEVDTDEAQSFRDELDSAKDEAEQVNFPGMYG